MSMERIRKQEPQESSEGVSFSLDRVLLGRAIEKKKQALLEVDGLIAERRDRLSEYSKNPTADPTRVEKLQEGIHILERTKKIRESERLTLLKELYGDAKNPTIQ